MSAIDGEVIAQRAKDLKQKALNLWGRATSAQRVAVGACVAVFVLFVALPILSATLRVVGMGGTSNPLPASQRAFFNKLYAMQKRKWQGFEPTRAGQEQRKAFDEQFEEAFMREVPVVGWRCFINDPHRPSYDQRCTMKNRHKDCIGLKKPCFVDLLFMSDKDFSNGYNQPFGSVDLQLSGDALANQQLYLGDLLEFDGVIRKPGAVTFGTPYEVRVSSVRVVAKETFTRDEYLDE